MKQIDWEKIRQEEFPILNTMTFLDVACVSFAPQRAVKAVKDFADMTARQDEANSSAHHIAMDALRHKAYEEAQKLLNADPEEIALVESTSHGLNIAAQGIELQPGDNIITTNLEFIQVALPWCVMRGEKKIDIRVCKTPDNRFRVEDFAKLADEHTRILVMSTLEWCNGWASDLKAIGDWCKEKGIFFVVDAVQQLGVTELDTKTFHVDLLTAGGHKWLNSPYGTGVLYVKKGITLEPLVYGGGQERGLVSGTENTAGCIGLAAAMKEAVEGLDEKMGYVKKLTDKLVKGIMENIPYSHYTGDPVNRLPGTASFVFEAIEGEGLILRLDNAGVCGSTGSACSTGSLDPSHVLMAIGLPHEIAHGSLRLTLGEQNTEEDVDYIIETVTDVVKTLRSMSPVWENGHPNLTAATELHAH